MANYVLFGSVLLLIFLRLFRPRKALDRLLLVAFFLLVLLALAAHPWLVRGSHWLDLLEKVALGTCLVWLATEPVLGWLEKRRYARNAFLLRNGKGGLPEIVAACRTLSEDRFGALIAIQRKDSLDRVLRSGVVLDAKIKKETICSLFLPPGALHDGGMVIRGERIASCGVLFPLSKRTDLPTELGTRHRAAIGLSEATDALTITVSEETGKISLADRGSLFYDVKIDKLPKLLEEALRNRLVRQKKSRN